jgi:hypothetical protein
MKFIVATVLAAGLVLSTAACTSQPSDYSNTGDTASVSQSSDTGSADSSPSPVTPDPVLPDISALPPISQQQALTTAGFAVIVVDSAGAPVADPTNYTFVSQSPSAGDSQAVGGTVTLTVAAPPPAPVVIAPAPAPAPASGGPGGATALCRDGSLSYSQHRQGTCSHHGGVATWY